jgi:hypothetical protein
MSRGVGQEVVPSPIEVKADRGEKRPDGGARRPLIWALHRNEEDPCADERVPKHQEWCNDKTGQANKIPRERISFGLLINENASDPNARNDYRCRDCYT